MELLIKIGILYLVIGTLICLILAIALYLNAIDKKREEKREKENPTPRVPRGDLGIDLIERTRSKHTTSGVVGSLIA